MKDLKIFCATEATRYSLETPFVIDGYEYFSDGRICIKRKTDNPDTTDKSPDFEEGFKQSQGIVLPSPIPITEPDCSGERCDLCLGTGREHVRCRKCDGFGCHDCDCGVEHDCGYCKAEGLIEAYSDKPCIYCNGRRYGYKDVLIDDVLFKGYYIGLIFRMFDNPRVVSFANSCKEIRDVLADTGPMGFAFDGGDGVLMSMKKK